jgi:hypothetical protein
MCCAHQLLCFRRRHSERLVSFETSAGFCNPELYVLASRVNRKASEMSQTLLVLAILDGANPLQVQCGWQSMYLNFPSNSQLRPCWLRKPMQAFVGTEPLRFEYAAYGWSSLQAACSFEDRRAR